MKKRAVSSRSSCAHQESVKEHLFNPAFHGDNCYKLTLTFATSSQRFSKYELAIIRKLTPDCNYFDFYRLHADARSCCGHRHFSPIKITTLTSRFPVLSRNICNSLLETT